MSITVNFPSLNSVPNRDKKRAEISILGFSLSWCVRSILRGEMPKEKIGAIIANTKLSSYDDIENVSAEYARIYKDQGTYKEWLDITMYLMIHSNFIQWRLNNQISKTDLMEDDKPLCRPTWLINRKPGWYIIANNNFSFEEPKLPVEDIDWLNIKPVTSFKIIEEQHIKGNNEI